MQSLIATLLACLPLLAVCQTWTEPAFCGGRNCPQYVVNTAESTADYEVRTYSQSLQWVSTPNTGRSFMRLFGYIQKNNDQNLKINMTVPVLRETTAAGESMMFYVHNPVPAPQPTGNAVTLQTWDTPKQFYVRVFTTSEKATPADYDNQLLALRNSLTSGTYNTAVSYTAGYHSPWFGGERHNEVWVPKL